MGVIEQMIEEREKAIDESYTYLVQYVEKYGADGPASVVQFYADLIVKVETEVSLLKEVDRRQKEEIE